MPDAKQGGHAALFWLQTKLFGAVALDPAKPGLPTNCFIPQPSIYSQSPRPCPAREPRFSFRKREGFVNNQQAAHSGLLIIRVNIRD